MAPFKHKKVKSIYQHPEDADNDNLTSKEWCYACIGLMIIGWAGWFILWKLPAYIGLNNFIWNCGIAQMFSKDYKWTKPFPSKYSKYCSFCNPGGKNIGMQCTACALEIDYCDNKATKGLSRQQVYYMMERDGRWVWR